MVVRVNSGKTILGFDNQSDSRDREKCSKRSVIVNDSESLPGYLLFISNVAKEMEIGYNDTEGLRHLTGSRSLTACRDREDLPGIPFHEGTEVLANPRVRVHSAAFHPLLSFAFSV